MQIKDAVNKYLQQERANGVIDNTLKRKARHLRYFCDYCDKTIEEVTIDDVLNFIVSLHHSEYVTYRIKQGLRLFFRYLREIGITNINYELIKTKKPASRPFLHMTIEEFNLIDRKLHTLSCRKKYLRLHTMHHLLFETGVRRHELLGIELKDIDFVNKIITVKTAKGGVYSKRRYFTDFDDYLKTFHPKKKLFNCSYNVPPMLLELLPTLGIHRQLSIHSYRAGFITYLHNKGLDIADIKDIIGHKSVEVTMGYIRNSQADLLERVGQCFAPEKNVKTEIGLGRKKIVLEMKIKNKC